MSVHSNIETTYECHGVRVRLSVDSDDNLPYNLAEMFRRIIDDTDANPEIVMESLGESYGVQGSWRTEKNL